MAIASTLGLVLILATSLVLGLGSDAEPVAQIQPTEVIPDGPRVEVLNAAGITGMARSATAQLRAAEFDVVYFGNASTFGRDSSVVLDRVGRPEIARRVADALGIEQVRTELDSLLYLEVSVLLGEDWEPGVTTTRSSQEPDPR